MISPDLAEALRVAAGTQHLLVASDYDGTLSELALHPDDARPHEAAIDALRALAGYAGTTVALISGRSRAELANFTGVGDPVVLIGSHGAERPGVEVAVHDAVPGLIDAVTAIAAVVDGSVVETRPTGVTFHYRTAADRDAVAAALAAIDAGPAALPGVRTVSGKEIVELTVSNDTKGVALAELRTAVGATATLFVGDDLSDEDAFAALLPGDVGVKVGVAPTVAAYRVPDVASVGEMLEVLVSLRR